MDNMFLAVKTSEDALKHLIVGEDIFERPMPWSLWFDAITRSTPSPWRFVRVSGLDRPLKEYIIFQEEDEVTFDERRFALERPTLLSAVEWGIEAIYYHTVLRFWEWPISRKMWGWLTRKP